jgi:hypothetical protein
MLHSARSTLHMGSAAGQTVTGQEKRLCALGLADTSAFLLWACTGAEVVITARCAAGMRWALAAVPFLPGVCQ